MASNLTTDFKGRPILKKNVGAGILERNLPNDLGCLGYNIPQPVPEKKSVTKKKDAAPAAANGK
jgi:hypothetical protein